MDEKILVIGAAGQVGTELTDALVEKYGVSQVLATDISDAEHLKAANYRFQTLDVMNNEALHELIQSENITQIYHLAAILSAKGEEKPLRTWDLNMQMMLNVLEASRELNVKKVFIPSSIAVFGPNTPQDNTPQFCAMDPNTIYGISKLAGERWGEYYFMRYGLDVRSLRYPGLISYKALPGGGTTDYAVEIFYEAVKNKSYSSFLKENSALPMMFMKDAIRATLELMDAPAEKIKIRSAYNLAGISFTPSEIAAEIQKLMPEFEISYNPDNRQKIADSWPSSIDDSEARKDWNWNHEYDLQLMTKVMLEKVSEKLSVKH